MYCISYEICNCEIWICLSGFLNLLHRSRFQLSIPPYIPDSLSFLLALFLADLDSTFLPIFSPHPSLFIFPPLFPFSYSVLLLFWCSFYAVCLSLSFFQSKWNTNLFCIAYYSTSYNANRFKAALVNSYHKRITNLYCFPTFLALYDFHDVKKHGQNYV